MADVRLSKFLSYVCRHGAEKEGIQLHEGLIYSMDGLKVVNAHSDEVKCLIYLLWHSYTVHVIVQWLCMAQSAERGTLSKCK